MSGVDAIKAALILVGLSTPAFAADDAMHKMTIEPCELDGVDGPVECGTLQVFEDQAAKQGRTISLSFAIARALDANTRRPDPVFFLTGGPGLSAISAAATITKQQAELRRDRDIVFLDQRGTGGSHPLPCPADSDRSALSIENSRLSVDEYRQCFAELSKIADLNQYSTVIAAHDIDEVRAALGYDKINLFGISYGTRLSLEVIRQHGAMVRSAFLISTVGPEADLTVAFPLSAQTALDTLIKDCADSAPCAAAYPDLANDVDQLFAHMRAGPVKVDYPDPRTNELTTATFGYDRVADIVSYGLYETRLSAAMPATLTATAHGDFKGIMRIAAGFGQGVGGGFWEGLRTISLCSEELPFADIRLAHENRDKSFLRDRVADSSVETCSVWPMKPMPATLLQQVTSNVPVLMVSGALDPITPPQSAQSASKGLHNARLIVIDKMAHLAGVASACVANLAHQFVTAANPNSVDASCTQDVKRPPFRTP